MDKYNIRIVLMPKAPHPFWGMKEWFVPTLDAVDNFLKKHFLIKG